MDDFSWTDGVRAALRPCFSCFAAGREEDGASDSNEGARDPRTNNGSSRRNDLEGFLRDPEETEGDAETWSLHSNIGRERRKRSRKNGKKGAKKNSSSSSFLSYFGRSKQAIRLPDSDSEEDGGVRRGNANAIGRSNSSSAASVSSSTAFDSDATSLDAGVVAKLSAQEALARAEREAEIRAEVERRLDEERREKAERKRNRMERRELRRASQLIALDVDNVGPNAFDYQNQLLQQHYQQGLVPSSHPSNPSQPTDYMYTQSRVHVATPDQLNFGNIIEEGHDDDAPTDFGGEAYAVKKRVSARNLRSVHGSSSDAGSSSARSSRSRTTNTTTTSSAADPSAIAYQRFLAMAALNGGQAAFAALPSPNTPALSLSPASASDFYQSVDEPRPSNSLKGEQDIVPPLGDVLKRKKKRRPETWIAPSTISPQPLAFHSPMTLPFNEPRINSLDLHQVARAPQGQSRHNINGIFNSALTAEPSSENRKKKNRMSMSGAL